jgi:hypothetical protein
MLREYRPDYVVERPGYLLRNATLNSRVPMFASVTEQEEFLRDYRPLRTFGTADVPKHLIHDYQFVVYARRRPEEASRWSRLSAHLSPEERQDLFFRGVTGPVELHLHTAQRPGTPLRP